MGRHKPKTIKDLKQIKPEYVEPKSAKEFECAICLDIFNQPVQIGCDEGHIFCQKCAMDLRIANKSTIRCPMCRQKCKISRSFNRVPFIDRQIKSLMVKCPNHCISKEKAQYLKNKYKNNNNSNTKSTQKEVSPLRRSQRIREKTEKQNDNSTTDNTLKKKTKTSGHKRKKREYLDEEINNTKKRKLNTILNTQQSEQTCCDWIGTFSEFNSHVRKCEFQLIECIFCDEQMLRNELATHHQNCLCFPIRCSQCNKRNIARNRMAYHITKVCPQTAIACEQCNEEIKRMDYEIHVKKNCSEAIIHCTFSKFGCDVTFKRKEMPGHNIAFAHKHLVKVTNSHLKLEKRLNKMEQQIMQISQRNNYGNRNHNRGLIDLYDTDTSSALPASPQSTQEPPGLSFLSSSLERESSAYNRQYSDSDQEMTETD